LRASEIKEEINTNISRSGHEHSHAESGEKLSDSLMAGLGSCKILVELVK
jgi:hypothetical protein